ncbi:MAG: anthranilate synthase component I family protein, partial [Cytophagales bacterium]|nr:anthranilate synthase component I family protein [Cytophagales bacterium]
MNQINIYTTYQKLLADTQTPVSLYLKLRDKFPNALLLESSDYHGTDDIYSYICLEPVAGISILNKEFVTKWPNGQESHKSVNHLNVPEEITHFIQQFNPEKLDFPFITNGIFGYMTYDAVRYYEDVQIKDFENEYRKIPELQYHLYRYILVVNHFNNELFIIENRPQELPEGNGKELIKSIIQSKNFAEYPFTLLGDEVSNFTDEEFLKVLQKGKDHCFRGDVFQIVLSRRFSRTFRGDEFNIYRRLRSINPSPYLFYFDYGNFKIFGSSPEAQIVVKNNKATIYPIAGTFRRTGNDIQDYDLAKKLLNDPKESSEHVMLVDLARNDLSRHCHEVKVETYKEVQYYSHVIHLVSRVAGQLDSLGDSMHIVADTFPAGTLSGAPKHNAMQLINKYENGNR